MKGPLRVPLGGIAPGLRELPREAAAYATRVHRLGPGAALVVFDPETAIEADAEIVEVTRRGVSVKLGDTRAARCTPSRPVTLLQGVGKGDKLDAIVRDATELGATRVVPVLCERSVTKPDAARSARWRRIAVDAARQSGRGDAPTVATPMPFADAVHAAGREVLGLCLDPAGGASLASVLAPLAGAKAGTPLRGVVIAVGPEGGLTEGEIATAVAAGFGRVSLGPIIVRTETACAAVLGALLALP